MRRSLELDNSVDEISPNNSYDKRGDISTFETWEEPLRTVEDALDNPENPYLYYYANGPLVYRRKKKRSSKVTQTLLQTSPRMVYKNGLGKKIQDNTKLKYIFYMYYLQTLEKKVQN